MLSTKADHRPTTNNLAQEEGAALLAGEHSQPPNYWVAGVSYFQDYLTVIELAGHVDEGLRPAS